MKVRLMVGSIADGLSGAMWLGRGPAICAAPSGTATDYRRKAPSSVDAACTRLEPR
jgi:hypothetical protein